MEQILKDFVKELFAVSEIPGHAFTLPCDDYEWLDLSLRTKLLGIDAFRVNELVNQRCEKLHSNTLVYYTDIFQLHYIFMKSENSSEIFCIGPILYERIEGSAFDRLFHSLHMPEQLREPMRSFYHNVKYLPHLGMLDNLTTLCADRICGKGQYEILYRDEAEYPNWPQIYQNYLRIPDEPFMNVRHIEGRYEVENALIQAVGRGNEVLAMECANRFLSYRMPRRLASQLRDDRDLCITLNTVLRKAAERAGVHPIHIDSFSNGNVQHIEQLANEEQIHSFRNKMIRGYCRLVNTYNLRDYSLPIQKAITYISTDLTSDLSLKSLAGQLNVNSSYLSTLFKKETGLPLTEYVNRRRIDMAKELLANTSYPLKSIATQCGISDIQYFTRMFKRITGMTPKTYRIQVNADHIL